DPGLLPGGGQPEPVEHGQRTGVRVRLADPVALTADPAAPMPGGYFVERLASSTISRSSTGAKRGISSRSGLRTSRPVTASLSRSRYGGGSGVTSIASRITRELRAEGGAVSESPSLTW